MIDENDGVSATETAVEAQVNAPVSTVADLTNMFSAPVEEVAEVEEESIEVEDPDEGEETEEETETEDTDESVEEEEDEAEEDEPEEGNVLSQHDKSMNKLRKRNKKLTKNWRTEQEETASLKEEVNQLKEQISSGKSQSSGESSFADMAGQADSIESLQEIYEKAEKAEEWVEDALDILRDSGEDTLVIEDKEYTRSEINAFKKETRKALKKDIPARAQLFQERVKYDEFVTENFDFVNDQKSEGYKLIQNYMSDKGLYELQRDRPDGNLMMAYAALGQMTHAKQQAQSSKGKDKTKETVKKPVSTPKIAPSIPLVRNTVAPARRSSEEKSVKVKNEIMKKNHINKNDLTKLFM